MKLRCFVISFAIFVLCIVPNEVKAINNFGINSVVTITSAVDLISSNQFTTGTIVRTLGYYKKNDGGGGLFIIEKEKPSKGETVLYYKLRNGLYANCIDSKIVLPRYGGVYVNQMLDNARPFLRPGIRDVIELPPSNNNHPGCSSYISRTGVRICFWQVNAPVLFDDSCSYSEIYLHDELVVAPDVSRIEAVIKIAGIDKPEDITFVSPVYVEGRRIDANNTIVAEHGILIQEGARIIFNKLQSCYAKHCITLGGGKNHEVEFSAKDIEASNFIEHGINIRGENQSIRFNIDKMHLQVPLGRVSTWMYVRGDVSQSNIGTLFCATVKKTSRGDTIRVFDIETNNPNCQVIDFDRVRISQCTEFGKISGGVYSIGSFCLTTPQESDVNVIIGKNTTIFCNYLKIENPIGDNWMIEGYGSSSLFHIARYSRAPKSIKGGARLSSLVK